MFRCSRFARVTLAAASLVLFGTVAVAQPQTDARARARELTDALRSLATTHDSTPPTARAAIVLQMVDVATARHEFLLPLFESDPGEVLSLAYTTESRDSLPPAVRALVEAHTRLEGTLEVLQEDDARGGRLLHYLQTGDARYRLHFAGNPPGLLTGDRVAVEGVQAISWRSRTARRAWRCCRRRRSRARSASSGRSSCS